MDIRKIIYSKSLDNNVNIEEKQNEPRILLELNLYSYYRWRNFEFENHF